MSVFYKNSTEHISDELKVLNSLLQDKFNKLKNHMMTSEQNSFPGVFISDNEAEQTLIHLQNNSVYDPPKNNLSALEQEIKFKREQSTINGIKLSLNKLSSAFFLDRTEEKILLACIASDLSKSYQTIYGYLQDDITKKRPTVSFLLDVFSSSIDDNLKMRRYFTKDSRLFKNHLLHIESQEHSTDLGNSIKINEHILNFLLDHEVLDPTISPFVEFLLSTKKQQVLVHEEYIKKIHDLCQIALDADFAKNSMFYLYGKHGIGKKTIAQQVCFSLGVPLMVIDLKKLVNLPNFDEIFSKILCDIRLHGCAVYLDNFEIFDVAKSKSLLSILADINNIFLFVGSSKIPPSEIAALSSLLVIDIPENVFSTRLDFWKTLLPSTIKQKDVADLASKFNFTLEQIHNSFFTANNLASRKKQNILISDLYEACRIQCGDNLSKLTQKIKSNYDWDSLILPPEKKQQLQQIINHVKYRQTIYDDWGFNSKVNSQGLNILFAGESGTGKTMASEIIAKKLNLDLYRLDLSTIVSKYIGETEKNLNQIFKEAENSNAILFFDEADSLFGKRSEVRDAHDRYANIEVGYLLQKLEQHQEIVILASNLPKNIDNAFMRRMNFWIDFPMPNLENRILLWKSIFPKQTPLSLTESDYEFLGERFQLSGGNIKNIALSSAFNAAEKSSPITMQNIIFSLKREYEKLGKPITKSEFGSYL